MAKKLTDLAATTGRGADELVQDALAGYLEELAVLRDTLDTRYDDLKSAGCSRLTAKKPSPDCARKATIGVLVPNERLRFPSGSVRRP